MPKHTPGPWIRGKTGDSIVAPDSPSVSMGFSTPEELEEYYGGALIAESILPHNQPIITAAPEMYEALRPFAALTWAMEEGNILCFRGVHITWEQAQAAYDAIEKATGG